MIHYHIFISLIFPFQLSLPLFLSPPPNSKLHPIVYLEFSRFCLPLVTKLTSFLFPPFYLLFFSSILLSSSQWVNLGHYASHTSLT